jgi:hypothetical protein
MLAGRGAMDAKEVHAALGSAYQALGRLDEAIEEDTLALAADAKSVPGLVALAVAYDRDEQRGRARDVMLRALALDASLDELRPTTFIVPEDLHYALGLGHAVAAEADPLRRAPAVMLFRRYLAAVQGGAGQAPARARLAALGGAAFAAGDMIVVPADATDREAIVRAVVGVGPELQRCLDGRPGIALRATLTIGASATAVPAVRPARPSPPGTLRTTLISPGQDTITPWTGSEAASQQNLECIEKTLHYLRLGARQLTRVQLSLIAR